MLARVDFLQRADRDLRINLRRGRLRVAELVLEIADVRAVLQRERRHRVPEEMARAPLARLGRVHGLAHELRQPAQIEGRPQVGQNTVPPPSAARERQIWRV